MHSATCVALLYCGLENKRPFGQCHCARQGSSPERKGTVPPTPQRLCCPGGVKLRA